MDDDERKLELVARLVEAVINSCVNKPSQAKTKEEFRACKMLLRQLLGREPSPQEIQKSLT